MKIGYQGVEGSNAEQAAHNMVRRLGLSEVEYIPLISSKSVIGELKRYGIEYAVVAVKNTLGGTVSETFNAIKNEFLELVTTEILPIRHCVFIRPESSAADIQVIISHEQALKQTQRHRAELFPTCSEQAAEDTAIAARYLAEGKYDKHTAVLCRESAGELYNLTLLQANIEDDTENYTEFRMFKLATVKAVLEKAQQL